MKTRQDFKNYSAYLDLHFNDQPARFLKFKNDVELSQVEKELLNSRLLIRDKQWDESLSRLEKLKTETPFLKAERYLQMGSIELLRSRYEESAKFNSLAVRFFEMCNDDIGLFRANYNMMAAFSRAGMNSLGHYFLTQSEKFAHHAKEKLIVARAKISFLSRECQFDEAIQVIRDIQSKKADHNKLEWEYFLTAASDVFFRAGKKEEATQIIEELMVSKTLLVRGRVIFYYHLSKFLFESKALPSKPQAVEQIAEYDLKWDLLEAVRDGESDRAQKIWQQLVSLFPHNYAPGYVCKSESESKSIFMQVLSNMFVAAPKSSVDLGIIKGKKAKLLLQHLMNSQTPMRKEILIEKIWGEDYRPELDARFYKLIERVKTMIALPIKNDNSAYYLADAS